MKYYSLMVLVCMIIGLQSTQAQCPRERLSLINIIPPGPSPDDEVRIVVAKEYENGCEGLQDAQVISVDQNNITLRFDEFCFENNSCSQAIHCDTAHYVIGQLNIGRYSIQVLDANMANDSCSPSQTVDTVGTLGFEVKDIEVTGQQFNAPPASRQCIPYQVYGFENLTDMQMSFRWDSTKLTYDTIRYLYPLAFLSDFNINSPRGGELRFIWTDNLVEGRDVPDGEVLFEVCFNVIGSAGDTVILDFDEGPIGAEGTDLDGFSYQISTTNSEIYITEDAYGMCSTDKDKLMCADWLKDTITNRYEEYCGDPDGSITLELVNWRGYTIIALTTTKINGGTEEGVVTYYSCDGEVLGSCGIGGANDGVCTDILLTQDISTESVVWTCSETLPGCYTVSQIGVLEDQGILTHNLVHDVVRLKNGLQGEIEIINTQGQIIFSGKNVQKIDLRGQSSGIYYIRSGNITEKFVLVK